MKSKHAVLDVVDKQGRLLSISWIYKFLDVIQLLPKLNCFEIVLTYDSSSFKSIAGVIV